MKTIFPVLLLFVVSFSLKAQEGESFPCHCCNPSLKVIAAGETFESIYVHGCSGIGMGNMATSFLLPSGQGPKPVKVEGEAPDFSAFDSWTCTYSPGNISDNDPKTAWVEGVDGNGEGELLLVSCIDISKPLEIWAGYGKSTTLFSQNARPKKIRTMIVHADTPGYTQYGTYYNNLKVIAKREVQLEDANRYQPLLIPDFIPATYYNDEQASEISYHYFLAIEVLEVYKGSKWTDTAISEVRNIENE